MKARALLAAGLAAVALAGCGGSHHDARLPYDSHHPHCTYDRAINHDLRYCSLRQIDAAHGYYVQHLHVTPPRSSPRPSARATAPSSRPTTKATTKSKPPTKSKTSLTKTKTSTSRKSR